MRQVISYPEYTQSVSSDFQSTSAYISNRQVQYSTRPMGMSAISASNFETLNNGEETVYRAHGVLRKGRPTGENDGPIGDYEFHSPVGDAPILLIALMVYLYAIFVKKRKKMQKNLVES